MLFLTKKYLFTTESHLSHIASQYCRYNLLLYMYAYILVIKIVNNVVVVQLQLGRSCRRIGVCCNQSCLKLLLLFYVVAVLVLVDTSSYIVLILPALRIIIAVVGVAAAVVVAFYFVVVAITILILSLLI